MPEGPEEAIAAELVRLAEAKLRAKGADAIFVNRVGAPGVGFASATNAGHLLIRDGERVRSYASGPPVAKDVLARWILAALARELEV